MTHDLRAVRARLDDPVAVATALGLIDGPRSYRRLTRGVQVRCPAHAERTPSCAIARTGAGVVWYCHGCKAGGDVLDLVAAVAGLDRARDFRRVVEFAAQLAGVRADAEPPAAAFAPPPAAEPARLDDDTFDALAGVIRRRCPVAGEVDAYRYLAARGLLDAAGPALAALPPDAAGQARLVAAIVAAVGPDAWARSGLASARSGGFVFPEHRLVAFWAGPGTDGLVQTIQRRRLRPDRAREEVGKYVFATGRRARWPYGLERADALGPGGEVAFCEGVLDALALRALCVRDRRDRLVLGLPGTTWSQPWAQLAAGRVAVVATDPDAAGEAAAARIAADLWAAGALDVRRETPTGAADWAALLQRSHGEAAA